MFSFLLVALTALVALPMASAGNKYHYKMHYNGEIQSFSCDYSGLGIDDLKQCVLSNDVFMLSTFGFNIDHFNLACPTNPLVALSTPNDLPEVALMLDSSTVDSALLKKIYNAIQAQKNVIKADEKLIKMQEEQLEKFSDKLSCFKSEVNDALQSVTDAYQHDYLTSCEKDELWPIIELLNDILRTICGLEEDAELIQQQLKSASKLVQKQCDTLDKLSDAVREWLDAQDCSSDDASRYLKKILKYAGRVYNAQYKFVLISEGVQLQLKALKTIRKVSEQQFKGILTSLRVTLSLIELQRLLKLGDSASNLYAIEPRMSDLADKETWQQQQRSFMCDALNGEYSSLVYVSNQATTLSAQGPDCQKLSDSDRTVLGGQCTTFSKRIKDLNSMKDWCSSSSSGVAMDAKDQLTSIKAAIVEAVKNVHKQSRGGPCSCDTITKTLNYLRSCHSYNISCGSDYTLASMEVASMQYSKDMGSFMTSFASAQAQIKKNVQDFFALLQGKPVSEDDDNTTPATNSTDSFCSECSASGSYKSYQHFQSKLAKHILYGATGKKAGLMHNKQIAGWLSGMTKNRKFSAADLLTASMDDQLRSLKCSALSSTSSSSRSDAMNSAMKTYQSGLHTKSSSSDVPFHTASVCNYWNTAVQNACTHYGMSTSDISQNLEGMLCTV